MSIFSSHYINVMIFKQITVDWLTELRVVKFNLKQNISSQETSLILTNAINRMGKWYHCEIIEKNMKTVLSISINLVLKSMEFIFNYFICSTIQ